MCEINIHIKSDSPDFSIYLKVSEKSTEVVHNNDKNKRR